MWTYGTRYYSYRRNPGGWTNFDPYSKHRTCSRHSTARKARFQSRH